MEGGGDYLPKTKIKPQKNKKQKTEIGYMQGKIK